MCASPPNPRWDCSLVELGLWALACRVSGPSGSFFRHSSLVPTGSQMPSFCEPWSPVLIMAPSLDAGALLIPVWLQRGKEFWWQGVARVVPRERTGDVTEGLVAFQCSPWDTDVVSSPTCTMLTSPRYGDPKIWAQLHLGLFPEGMGREGRGHYPAFSACCSWERLEIQRYPSQNSLLTTTKSCVWVSS